jgi:hypothetical protein
VAWWGLNGLAYRGNLSSGGAIIFRCNVQRRFGECKS